MAYKQINTAARRLYSKFSRQISGKSEMRRNIGIGGVALLSIPITTFCLGTWQVKRHSWKLNLIEEVKTQCRALPVDLPDNLEEISKMEYRRVQVHGKFDHSKELYIGPRQLVTEKDEGGGLMSSRPQSGYYVIAPFHIKNKNIIVLVNRGWVPRNKIDPTRRTEGQVEEEIDLIGIVRLPEKRPQFCPKSQSGSNHFLFRDVPKMAQLTGADSIFIDADATSTVSGGPIGGQTRITFRNEHFSYIVTWYSLCAATSYMWYRKYLHRIKA